MATPGVRSSGLFKKGIDLVTGASHAAKVAAVTENPKTFKKSRLLVGEESSLAFPTNSSTGTYSENSFLLDSTNSGACSNSSMPFQYFLVSAIALISAIFLLINLLY